jgi:tetratricopeptide (TPR) repeat protein
MYDTAFHTHLQKASAIMGVRPDLAVKELTQALAIDPDNSHAHALLSGCLLDLHRKAEALEAAQEAVRLSPDLAYPFYALARCQMSEDRYIDAEVAIDEALRIEPFNPDYLWLLALIQVCSQEFSNARDTLDRALEYDPQHANSHSLRAYVLNKLGKTAESDQSSDTALSMTPDDAWTHTFRGWALVERQDLKGALPHFREALRIDPTCSWARDGLIRATPSQHWAFRLHLKLRNKSAFVITGLWLIANIYLHVQNADHPSVGGLLAIYASWLTMVVYFLFLFLPDSIVAGPVLKFLLQFEPDGRYILSTQEKYSNWHLVFFLATFVVAFAAGMINHLWWPLGASLILFWLSRPLLLPESERNRRSFGFHALAAVFSAVIVWALANAGGLLAGSSTILRTVVAIQLVKALASAGGLKVIAGGLGAGALAAAAKQKQKDEARAKLMKRIDPGSKS